MEDNQTNEPAHKDEEFRRKRQWASFKGVLYAGLGSAAFIGVLQNIVKLVMESMTPAAVDAVKALSGGAEVTVAQTATTMLADPMVLLTAGGFMAAGTFFTYLAQKEWTDVKFMEDEQLARKNAECMQREKAKAKAQEQQTEYPQNQRADGKQWLQVVGGQDVAQHHAR